MKQGWELKKLGDKSLLEIIDGDRGKNYPTKSDFLEEGFCLFMNTKNVTSKGLDFKTTMFINESKDKALGNGKLKRNDVIMTTRGTIGNLGIYSDNVEYDNIRINSGMLIFRPNLKVITPGYLYKILQSEIINTQIKKYVTGAAQPQLPIKTLVGFTFPVPNSLSEQQRIVAILNEAFDAITGAKENAEKNLQNARELFESYLQSVFANPGDGWEEKKLGDVCEKITKGSSPNWQCIKYLDFPGILFITSENVGKNELILDKRKYVEERFNSIEKKSILKNGDVLTNIVGASIGRTAIFTLDDVANINQAVCILRCNSNILYNFYLMYLLNSPFFRKILHDNEVDNARANLSLGFFSNLNIPIPPLNEQHLIVDKLEVFFAETKKLEDIYNQKLTDLEELKKSILQKAFNGEL